MLYSSEYLKLLFNNCYSYPKVTLTVVFLQRPICCIIIITTDTLLIKALIKKDFVVTFIRKFYCQILISSTIIINNSTASYTVFPSIFFPNSAAKTIGPYIIAPFFESSGIYSICKVIGISISTTSPCFHTLSRTT